MSSCAERSRDAARHIRRTVLTEAHRAGVGHIGSALSVADIIAAVYASSQNFAPHDPDRDRVILSKGHAALALFAALNYHGLLSDEVLQTYCQDGASLGVHPESDVHGIDFSAGSLGQGLSFAAGAALAARLEGSSRMTYAIVSDAECNEGSIWEAAMFAGHRGLDNLVVFIDLNGQQALGYTDDISAVTDMAARWRSFGWNAVDVDGHDHEGLLAAVETARSTNDKPTVVVAHTTFGYGVSYMQNEIKWHYLPMDESQFHTAIDEIEALA